MSNTLGANGLKLDQIGWRYYNRFKKKAMEQEFSWTGLVLSLSIAFFIVIVAALLLNLAHQAVQSSGLEKANQAPKIYRLEADDAMGYKYLDTAHISSPRPEFVKSPNIA